MRRNQAAGFALAVCVCAGVAFFAMQGKDVSVSTFVAGRSSTQHEATGRADVRVPDALSLDTPKAFALDAATMRRAVRDGELRVALPDGTQYPVRIERTYTDKQGKWNVVGRADTRLGPQPMVMTFGGTAVFGILPQPDGRALHVTTGPRGTEIAPAGNLVPRDLSAPSLANDAVMPPARDGSPAPPFVAAVASDSPSSMRHAASRPASLVRAASAPIDTTPLDVELFFAWTPEQETLRGNSMNVSTEVSNLVAIANQAHIDSGSRVRFVVYRVYTYALPTTRTNASLLTFIATDDSTRETIRHYRGDLAFVLRPRPPGDSCGAAYVTSTGHARTGARTDYGFGVISSDAECSPLMFAHESGHSLGAMHDRASETDARGKLNLGAYVFSYGHRTDTFATLMATPTATQPWVPYFANPASTLCNGEACGIEGVADDVRTFNLMAPAIASLRTHVSVGMAYISVASVEALEPRIAPVTIPVEVRMQGAGVGSFSTMKMWVQVVGGTATRGVDYTLDETTLVEIPKNSTHFDLPIRLLPDSVVEGDETILLKLSAYDDFPFVDEMLGRVTIVEAPRFVLEGQLRFPITDIPDPTTPVEMEVRGIEDSPAAFRVSLVPPNFAYRFEVPVGAQVELGTVLPSPYWLGPNYPLYPDVRASETRDLVPQIAYQVSGQMRAEPGTFLPGSSQMRVMIGRDGGTDFHDESVWLQGPDYRYAFMVPRGLDLTIAFNGSPSFARNTTSHWKVEANKVQDLVVGARPTLRAVAFNFQQGWNLGVPVILDGPAPVGGVSMRCRTSDGTAKAGSDYVAMTATLTIPEGEEGVFWCGQFQLLPDTTIEKNERLYVDLDQVTNAIVSTPRAPITLIASKKPQKVE